MAVKNDAGIAKRAAALTHHGHGGTTSKLSHNNSSVAMHPTERIATPRRLRTALILPPMAVVASANEPSFSGKAPHALHRLNGGMTARSDEAARPPAEVELWPFAGSSWPVEGKSARAQPTDCAVSGSRTTLPCGLPARLSWTASRH